MGIMAVLLSGCYENQSEYPDVNQPVAFASAPLAASQCVNVPFDRKSPSRAVLAASGQLAVVAVPEWGKVIKFQADQSGHLKVAGEIAPPPYGPFGKDAKGFGHSAAVAGRDAFIGGFRTGTAKPSDQAPFVEYPAGVFHEGAVYRYQDGAAQPDIIDESNAQRAVGYSMAGNDKIVAHSLWHKPAKADVALALAKVTKGGVGLFRLNTGKTEHIPPPSGATGFGFSLQAHDDSMLVTAPFSSAGTTVYEIQNGGSVSAIALPDTLSNNRFVYAARNGSWLIMSSAGGWSPEDAFGVAIAQDGTVFQIDHGGPIAVARDRLIVVEPAMPEGSQVPVLYEYSLKDGQQPELISQKRSVITATFVGQQLMYLKSNPNGGLRLCVE